MKVTFERGILLPELDLWLDPQDERDTAFVSHAHSDHIGNHREVILSEITAQFDGHPIAGQKSRTLSPVPLADAFSRRLITLLPAGHIFGSAQIHIHFKGETLLYTGDFKLRKGMSC